MLLNFQKWLCLLKERGSNLDSVAVGMVLGFYTIELSTRATLDCGVRRMDRSKLRGYSRRLLLRYSL